MQNKASKTQDPDDSEYSENDDDLEEERQIIALAKEQALLRKRQKKEEQDNKDDEEEKQMFLNPLLAFKNKINTEGEEGNDDNEDDDKSEWSDDDKYEPKETKEQRRERREKERKMIGKRKRAAGIQGDMDDVKDFFANTNVEEVPQTEIQEKRNADDLPEGYSSMDSDDIAETRALAKKMLRKKFRTETIDNSYSRYAYEDDENIVPDWFLEDEAKNNKPNINLTKEEVD